MLKEILDFVTTQIFQNPAFFMGLVVFVGCMFMRKDAKDTLVSVIRTVVGMMILSVGAEQLKITSENAIDILTTRLGLTGVSTDTWTAAYAYIEQLEMINTGNVVMVMVTAWIVNLILAKFTPIKTIYLTGHIAYCDSALITYFLYKVCGFTDTLLFVSAVSLCAIYWWLFPEVLRRFLVPMQGDEPRTLGHNLCVAGIITTQLARLFGNKEENSATIEFSGWFSIFKDSVVAYSVIMGLIYTAITIIGGPKIVAQRAGDINFVIYGVNQGLTMAAGVYILMSGANMFLDELLPAFRGFSEKLVPGAIAAVDIPLFWSYAPNAALLGFLCTVAGQFVGVGLLALVRSPIIAIPSVIPLFFGGCTLGVFADFWGGWKGVIGSTFIMGVITICGSAALAHVVGTNFVPGHSDWSTLWLGVMYVLKLMFKDNTLA